MIDLHFLHNHRCEMTSHAKMAKCLLAIMFMIANELSLTSALSLDFTIPAGIVFQVSLSYNHCGQEN